MQKKQIKEKIVLGWSAILIMFFLCGSLLSYWIIHNDKVASDIRHINRLALVDVKNDNAEINQAIRASIPSENQVKVGMYVERIIKLQSTDTEWVVEFYLWFTTQNPDLKPGESFQILNGDILESVKIKENAEIVNGQKEYYSLYKVIGSITKFFNIVRYPLDNHLLTIQIEDKSLPLSKLEYIADQENSVLSSRMQAPGYDIVDKKIVSRVHSYQTNRGDITLTEAESLHSQFAIGLSIKRPDLGLYLKMFQGLFAAVTVALITFFLGYGSGDRIGIGIGAFFAAVANNYISLNELPHGGLLTLTDIVNGIGLFTIMMTIASAQIANWLADRQQKNELAKLFDRTSFAICLLGYIGLNTLVVLTA